MRKIFILLFASWGLHAAASNDSLFQYKPFQPENQHQAVFQILGQSINMFHYNKPKLDDAMSSKFYDNYIHRLDPSKVYFTKADSSAFEKNRFLLDDQLIAGNCQTGFDMYNVFQKKVYERTQFALDLLQTNLDFSSRDSFLFDRDKAEFALNERDLDRIWKQKITYEVLVLKLDGKADSTCIDIVRKRYINLIKQFHKTKSEDVFSFYANAFTETADQHTNYFSPRSADDFNTSMSLSLEGIGATLQTENEYTKVREVVKGGPADKSKQLVANDRIIGVGQGKDGEIISILDWRIDDVVGQIRGKKGTIVRLEVIPHDAVNNKSKIIEITRDKIVLEDQASKSSLKHFTQNGKKYTFGVITVPAFYLDFAALERHEKDYKSTTKDVRRLLNELKKDNPDGIIIDLRNNGGGSLKEAIELSGLFIKNGPVVQVKDVQDNLNIEEDKDSEILWDGPLAIMVNSFSASASEIFAAAMQDYGRALIIGEQTYGKGTVQNMMDLNNFIQIGNTRLGQLKMTIAKFYRISGGSTQHRGVIPDISFPTLFPRDEFGENASKFSLPYDEIKPAQFQPVNRISNRLESLKKDHNARIQSNKAYSELLEDIHTADVNRNRTYITLNFEQLKAENDQLEKQKKEREAGKPKDSEKYDLILEETSGILSDYIR